MKKYGVVKIKDPSTDGHSVRLLPSQSFELVCTKSNPADHFGASVVGDFLLMSEARVSDHQVVFKFKQKYDVSDWVKISNVFLGNILLSKNISGLEEKVRLCVICTDVESKDSVLTVVNPENVLVKIEPHQILHIVNYDEDARRQGRWGLDNIEGLKCVRCETVLGDFNNVYDQNALFCPEPRGHGLPINPDIVDPSVHSYKNNILSSKGLITEYHFWSCLTSAEIRRMYTSANGSYKMGKVTLSAEYENARHSRQFELVLSVRGKKKIDFEHFKAIYSLANCWNERHLSYVRHSIFNPRINENLEVSDSDGWFYVEIPNPAVYFEHFGCDSAWVYDPPEVGSIQCHELRSRYVNGNMVQRFLITGISTSKDFDLMVIGTVNFHASDRNETKLMSLCFWKIPTSHFEPFTHKTENVKRRSRLIQKVEVELEIVDDGILAGEDAITPLCYIDENDVDYSEYSGGFVNRMVELKKKSLLLLPEVSTNVATTLLLHSLGKTVT